MIIGVMPLSLSGVFAEDIPINAGYGSSGKFLKSIEPPVAGSIPISSRAELESIRNNLNGTYHLTADIDLSGAEWVPIGIYYLPFNGTLDGQGYVIRNLKIGTMENQKNIQFAGLFGCLQNAVIMNIGLEELNINIRLIDTVSSTAGGICGYSSGSVSISNCYNTGDIFSMAFSASSFAGGICGLMNVGTGSISNCYNTGDIFASSPSRSDSVDAGGICGRNLTNVGINNCYNTGDISAFSSDSTSTATAGGICGISSGYSSISKCYNTGEVSTFAVTSATTSAVVSSYSGGICGKNSNSISDCYNIGEVSAFASASNSRYPNSSSFAGGICGRDFVSINNCYNTSNISAFASNYSYTGSITTGGSSLNTTINNSYCLNLYGSSNGTQLTAEQMHNQSSFVDWDFDNVWGINSNINNGFPYLKAFVSEEPPYPIDLTPFIFTTITGDTSFTNIQNGLTSYEEQRLNLLIKLYNFGYIYPEMNDETKQKTQAKNVQIYIDYPDGVSGFSSSEYPEDWDEVTIIDLDTGRTSIEINVGNLDWNEERSYNKICVAKPTSETGSYIFIVKVLIDGELVDTKTHTVTYDNEITGTFFCLSSASALGLSTQEVDTKMNFTYKDSYFYQPSTTYNHNLAIMSLKLELSSYTTANACKKNNKGFEYDDNGFGEACKNIDALYNYIGFSPIKYFNYDKKLYDESDKVAFSLAEKRITINGKETIILAIVVRGGGYGGEWVSNGNVGNGENHTGFLTAANQVIDEAKKIIDDYASDSIVKLWITGFNRGAATANLVAAKMNEYASGKTNLIKEDIYAYTFATPLNTKDIKAQSNQYNNIFNIINPVDLVPNVPFASWDFDRYGISLALGFIGSSNDNYNNLNNNYNNKFISLYNGNFDKKLVTWEQYIYIYDVAYILTSFVKTSNDYANNLQPYIKNTLRNHYKGNLNFDSGYENLFLSTFGTGYKNYWDESFVVVKNQFMYNPILWIVNWDVEFVTFILCSIGIVTNSVETITFSKIWDVLCNAYYVEGYDFNIGGFGSNVGIAHTPESYLVLLESATASTAFGSGKIQNLKIACPVDIEIYDNKGTLLGKVINNVVDESIVGDIAIFVDNDEKNVYLPFDTKYSIKFVGTDTGTMDYTVTVVDVASTQSIQTKAFTNVVLFAGKKMTSGISGEVDTPDIQLFVTDGNQIIGEIFEDGTETTTRYTITATAGTGGTASGGGTFNTNATVILTAMPNIGYAFDGWYENNEKIVDAGTTYTFTATADRMLEARFIPNTVTTFGVTVNNSYSYPSGAGNYAAGKIITIDAGSRSNYSFTGWTVSGVTFANANNAATSFTMPANDVTVTANWSYNGGGSISDYTQPSTQPTSPLLAETTTTPETSVTSTAPIGGAKTETPDNKESDKNDNDSMAYPGSGEAMTPGGIIEISPGTTITVPSGTELNPDGVISFPEGSGGAKLTYGGYTFNINENAVIVLDSDVPFGYSIMIDNPFGDIKESDWFYDDVMFAYSHGLMVGTSADPAMFNPNKPLTRAMVVTVLYRLLGSPSVSDLANPFGDVLENTWYTDAVIWAAENGIVKGYADDKFGPDDNITRQDLAVIFYRFEQFTDKIPMDIVMDREFNDWDDISDYAKNAVNVLTIQGILNGYEDGAFKPMGQATRAEFAAVLRRFIEASAK